MMLGVIADDLTGATDIAAVLVERGFRSLVLLGAGLDSTWASDADVDALVVALKSRTAPAAESVAMSLAAFDQLVAAGCDRFYLKYCSTFDSTARGNIGPVLDALLARLGASATVVVPAYPPAARTVYQGHLFVGEQLLGESSMRDHPLTPMTDSDLRRLLRPQTKARVESVTLAQVREGTLALRRTLAALAEPTEFAASMGRPPTATPVAIVIDAIADQDLTTIAAATADWPLLTGSAGLAAGLSGPRPNHARSISTHPGRRLVLCGSASMASRKQVDVARAQIPSAKLDLSALANDHTQEIARLADWLRTTAGETAPTTPSLIYAMGPEDGPVAPLAAGQLAAAIENCFAELALAATRGNTRQLLVAGGETSGAVVKRLRVRELSIGPSIAQGVPWTSARLAGDTEVNLALKSGNFGDPDIFVTAWRTL